MAVPVSETGMSSLNTYFTKASPSGLASYDAPLLRTLPDCAQGQIVRTKIVDPHGMVVGLRNESAFGVLLHLEDERVVEGEWDVLDQQRLRLVQIVFPRQEYLGISRDRGPTVDSYGLVGRHCAGNGKLALSR